MAGEVQPQDTGPVRSIFASGFPPDYQPRELCNMFRFCDGFEASTFQPGPAGKSSMGFARFNTPEQAQYAIDKLNNATLDPNFPGQLRVQMARKNLHPNAAGSLDLNMNMVPNNNPGGGGNKRPRIDASAPPPPAAAPPGFDQWAAAGFGGGGYDMTAFGFAPPGLPDPYSFAPPYQAVPAPSSNAAHALQPNNPPSTTLFVGKLGRASTEQELYNVFAVQPGFQRLAFSQREGKPSTCFVEFVDPVHSAQALQALQGTMLPSSEGIGIRLEFSKNPLGVKSSGQPTAMASAIPRRQ